MPTISVIIPVYNAEKYLKDTVTSVLEQNYKDIELLLIDDGSADASPSICDEFSSQDYRVRVIHKKNGGVSSARNVGLDHATGEFVVFLDNDDLLYPDFVETLVNHIDSYDYLLAAYVEGGEEERRYWQELERKHIPTQSSVDAKTLDEVRDKAQQLRLMNFGVILCTLFRKSIIDKYALRFPITQYEDTIFIYNYVSHCNNMRKIFYEGYFYYRHSDSQGHSHKYIAEQEAIVNIDQAFQAVIDHFAIKDGALIDIFRQRIRSAIRSYLLKGFYQDTRVGTKTQLSRWRSIAHTSFLCTPYYGKMSLTDRIFGILLKIAGLF